MGNKSLTRILLVTTVPETLLTILKDQPRYLATYFDVVLVTSLGKELQDVSRNEGLQVLEVPMVRGIDPLKDICAVLKMICVLRKMKPDVVHSYTPKAGLVSMLAAFVCRVPVRVHTFTGLIFPTSNGFKRSLLVAIDKLICFCATNVVPEGEGVKADLHRFGITKRPLSVIGFGNIAGVDTKHFSRNSNDVLCRDFQRNCLSVSSSSFVFCFVGRLNRDKGLSELMEAFLVLPTNAHLLLIGELDESAPVDDKTLFVMRNNPRVHCLGFLKDIRSALCSADVLVLPSYREGFPNVVLQAGAMEVPVIASNINGCNEIVEEGRNGWLVPPRDANTLAKAMRRAMVQSEGTLKEMGREGRRIVMERFEREAHWRRMRDFYAGLVK